MNSDAVMSSRVAVAFSGGRDSTALLYATACAAREQGGLEVVALHVHHGLSAHADAWLSHAQQQCDVWATQGLPVRLISRHVQLALKVGDSVEASARHARYAALADMAREADAEMILLAHHRRDQAETFLLQALRGAGISGLASMPADIDRDGLRWVRPWLTYPREAIEAYVAHHGLLHIEDDSNTNTRFARNRLRLDVWPALLQAFPHAEASLASSAARLADVLPGVEGWRAQLMPMRWMPRRGPTCPVASGVNRWRTGIGVKRGGRCLLPGLSVWRMRCLGWPTGNSLLTGRPWVWVCTAA
jgi:tRNA(Ile)-lysidine synthase